MPLKHERKPEDCACLAIRQAARHVTQFYDRFLAEAGLRTTQFSILAKLKRLGPMSINALARELVMDRTTLGRTMLPLERDGLIAVKDGRMDRRSKELAVTKAGSERLHRAGKLWVDAQRDFEDRFGARHAADLRNLLTEVVSCDLVKAKVASTLQGHSPRANL